MFKKHKTTIIWSACLAVLLAFTIVANVLCKTTFDKILTLYFGGTEAKVNMDDLSDEVANLDKKYVKTRFKKKSELADAEREVCQELASEGYVLLKNENNVLPLNTAKDKVSLWGQASYNYMCTGTGTGGGSNSVCVSLRDGLKSAGININENLWNYYKNGSYSVTGTGSGNADGKYNSSGAGAIQYGAYENWTLYEVPYDEVVANAGITIPATKTTDDVAIYTVTRFGGEGRDLARSMQYWTVDNMKEEDAGKHYLELTSVEQEILQNLRAKYGRVVLLVNTNNPFELGNAEQYADAVIWATGGGVSGTKALGELLAGKTTFSGHLADTFAYDAFSSPAMQNIGEFQYENNGAKTGYYYLYYKEGIYVGYKYYETRYEDAVLNRGNASGKDVFNTEGWNYETQVQYPFGYGLSYTSFEWSGFEMKQDGTHYTAEVTVKNTGNYDGKEVVQLYYQSEYTDYDRTNKIEKSAVNLLGYAKTDLLTKNGGEQTVTIEFDEEDLKCYDEHGAGTYILDAGKYYFTAAKDAHSAVNNILKAKNAAVDGNAAFVTSRDFKANYTKYSKDTATGTPVVNEFDYQSDRIKTYLSRSDWTGTYPTTEGNVSKVKSEWSERTGYQYRMEVDDETLAKIKSDDSLNPDQQDGSRFTDEIVDGTGTSELELIDMRGRDFKDPFWKDILDQLTCAEIKAVTDQVGWQTAGLTAISKPYAVYADGSTGLVATIGAQYGTMTYTSCVMLACTFNPEMAFKYGDIIGEDGLWTGVSGWYAPSMNIHRSAFSGRNFEYYSEDPVLSGIMGANAVRGAAAKGMVATVKHFAMNDSETCREKTGLVTWANEQSIRDLYLRPFEMAVKDSGTVDTYFYEVDADGNYNRTSAKTPACMGIMSSFSRIGCTWAGGNYRLITKVLREEWGFNGFVITDYQHPHFMFNRQIIYAGGDGALKAFGESTATFNPKDSSADYHYAAQAMKHILYATANSAAMNGYIHGAQFIPGFAYYNIILIALDVVAAGVTALGVFFIIRSYKKKPKAGNVSQQADGE